MKNLLLIASLLFITISCSQVEDLNNAIDDFQPHPENSKVNLKFDNTMYVDETNEPNPNPDNVKISTFKWVKESSGDYYIKGNIKEANPMSVFLGGTVTIRLGKTIEIGKVFDVSTMYNPSTSGGFGFYAKLGTLPISYYQFDENTRGTFKVTAFDGKSLSIELNLTSVENYTTDNIPSKRSTVTGTLTGILGENNLNTSTELPSYIPTNGLVGWWPFNNNANDISGNTNNGTVTSAILSVDRFGNANSAYSFNGINSYINMPSGSQTSMNVTSDFTLGFWFKTSQTGSGLIGFGDNSNGKGGYLVAIGNGNLPNGANKLSVFTGDSWHGGNAVVSDNQWHYACVTLNGSNLKIIIDNKLDISIDNVKAPTSFNGLRAIGARNNGSGGNFNGIVDDIGLWNRALEQNEISNLYNAKPSYIPTNGLVAYYPLNGNANDTSDNNHNGTVNGATLTTDRFGNTNSSYYFNGQNNKITLANSQNLVKQSFSVTAWVTIDNLMPTNYDMAIIGQFNGLIADERKWMFGYRAIQNVKGIGYYIFDNLGEIQNNAYSLDWTPKQSTWYNITWVFDSGKSIKTYVNGNLHANVPCTLTNYNNTASGILTTIGNCKDLQSGNDLAWNGKIDDLGIWNRVLTQDEINNLYNAKQ